MNTDIHSFLTKELFPHKTEGMSLEEIKASLPDLRKEVKAAFFDFSVRNNTKELQRVGNLTPETVYEILDRAFIYSPESKQDDIINRYHTENRVFISELLKGGRYYVVNGAWSFTVEEILEDAVRIRMEGFRGDDGLAKLPFNKEHHYVLTRA